MTKLCREQRQTSLFFAVANGSEDAVDLLIRSGADPNLDRFKVFFDQDFYEEDNLR